MMGKVKWKVAVATEVVKEINETQSVHPADIGSFIFTYLFGRISSIYIVSVFLMLLLSFYHCSYTLFCCCCCCRFFVSWVSVSRLVLFFMQFILLACDCHSDSTNTYCLFWFNSLKSTGSIGWIFINGSAYTCNFRIARFPPQYLQ